MDEIWTRFVEDMSDRATGPMKFRLQPVMASVFAIRSGLAAARAGRPHTQSTAVPDATVTEGTFPKKRGL